MIMGVKGKLMNGKMRIINENNKQSIKIRYDQLNDKSVFFKDQIKFEKINLILTFLKLKNQPVLNKNYW